MTCRPFSHTREKGRHATAIIIIIIIYPIWLWPDRQRQRSSPTRMRAYERGRHVKFRKISERHLWHCLIGLLNATSKIFFFLDVNSENSWVRLVAPPVGTTRTEMRTRGDELCRLDGHLNIKLLLVHWKHTWTQRPPIYHIIKNIDIAYYSKM